MKAMKRNVLAGLAGLAVLLLAHAPVATAGPGGSGVQPSSPASDDVTTSPITSSQAGPGFVLTVPTELTGQVLAGIRGQGRIRVEAADASTTRIELAGRFVAVLPKGILETKGFALRYLGDRGRERLLQRGDRLILIQR
ncbi:MAG TPA: hypothetical protein ENJ09_11425 [Planctomycetes bacterium]|nr:hypothetical protein [Planctomycetota bacterium]